MDSFGDRLWHTDASFRRGPVALSMRMRTGRGTRSRGEGDTEFADLAPPMTRRREHIKLPVTEHSIFHSRTQIGFTDEGRAAMLPAPRRLVRSACRGPAAGVYTSPRILTHIGWPMPDGRLLTRDLIEHATQPAFAYAHDGAKVIS